MNIILIHIGPNLPAYFWICLQQIRRYYKGKIIVCFDDCSISQLKILQDNNVSYIRTDNYLNNIRLKEFNQAAHFLQEDFWNFTFKRLFILEEIIREYDLKNVIHMENDILIYENPEDIDFSIYNKVAVNPVGPKYATYAYTYIPNYGAIKMMNDANLIALNEGKEVLAKRYDEGGWINEMLQARVLLRDGVIDALPTVTRGDGSEHYEHFNSLFDGSAYGQYVGGTSDCIPGWKEKERYVGEELIANNIDIFWAVKTDNNDHLIRKEPYVVDKLDSNKLIKLNNLHIHSKQLEKYI